MKILLRNSNDPSWQLVDSASYADERELQTLLLASPDLIPIHEMRDGASQLAVGVREFNLSIGYVDMLAFSAKGDIAIIECKMANNPEIKRKVIGQVLEYGAALWKMRYELLDEKIKERSGKNLIELLSASIDLPECDEEEFRSIVETNLDEGNFILVIVVDEINDNLTQIIRFLNNCGTPNFSFSALEMRRFQSGQAEILVPRVEEDPRQEMERSSETRRSWDKKSLFRDAKTKVTPKAYSIMEGLFDWCNANADEVRFGTGVANGSFTFLFEQEGKTGSVFSVYSDGKFSINFGYMPKIFTAEAIANFQDKLSEIPPFREVIEADKYYFYFDLNTAFEDPENLTRFKNEVLALKEVL